MDKTLGLERRKCYFWGAKWRRYRRGVDWALSLGINGLMMRPRFVDAIIHWCSIRLCEDVTPFVTKTHMNRAITVVKTENFTAVDIFRPNNPCWGDLHRCMVPKVQSFLKEFINTTCNILATRTWTGILSISNKMKTSWLV